LFLESGAPATWRFQQQTVVNPFSIAGPGKENLTAQMVHRWLVVFTAETHIVMVQPALPDISIYAK